jgi:hypothetical protein
VAVEAEARDAAVEAEARDAAVEAETREVVGVALVDLLIRLLHEFVEGGGLLDHLDHLGPGAWPQVKPVLRRVL